MFQKYVVEELYSRTDTPESKEDKILKSQKYNTPAVCLSAAGHR
jgi:hypothetical protein